MALVDTIRNVLPVSFSLFGEAAVTAYAALPGVDGWMPPAGFQPIQPQRLVQMGWPLAVLGANEGLKRILRKWKNGKIDASDWSVIHTGALLTHLGARVEFLKEGQS